MPESLVVLARYAFGDLRLHRLQVAIIPRNARSRRVVDKLGLRNEGIAERYLEINGVWEDHVRYAITSEEWAVRRDELVADWLLDGVQSPASDAPNYL
jgi:ribosomal-protein-alanine N-acetyltransferase